MCFKTWLLLYFSLAEDHAGLKLSFFFLNNIMNSTTRWQQTPHITAASDLVFTRVSGSQVPFEELNLQIMPV